MLIQLVIAHPESLGPIVRNTPTWVWGVLAALLALGASQLRERRASLGRVSALPVAMTAFSMWGTFAAFGSSPLFAQAVGVWTAAAGVACAVVAPGRAGGLYDPASRTYVLPGSAVPLLLIAGIFLVKYAVGVELALAPQAARDPQYVLAVAALYGGFTGMFLGRAARLWRLALRGNAAAALA